jgi:hypothetical protein
MPGACDAGIQPDKLPSYFGRGQHARWRTADGHDRPAAWALGAGAFAMGHPGSPMTIHIRF